jgi:hypothetical protein
VGADRVPPLPGCSGCFAAWFATRRSPAATSSKPFIDRGRRKLISVIEQGRIKNRRLKH